MGFILTTGKRVSAYVQLPEGDPIDCFAFVLSITKATVPDMNPKGTGLECIVGKLVVQRIPGIEEPLLSEQSLECDDRKFLRQVLPKLPELRIPLFENVANAFMDAYRQLKERPITWEPVLITEARYIQERERRRSKRWVLFERHQKELQRRFDQGHIELCDRDHVPMTEVKLGTMIPRTQAIAYLKDCGLTHDETPNTCASDVATASKGVPDAPEAPESSSDGRTSTIGARKVSLSDRAAAVQLYNDLKRAGAPNYTMQTARKFGVSERSVSKWVKEAEAENQKKERPQPNFFPTST